LQFRVNRIDPGEWRATVRGSNVLAFCDRSSEPTEALTKQSSGSGMSGIAHAAVAFARKLWE
jgi:hypothetical protein